MTTKLDSEKISQLLTQSARQLDSTTLSALAGARQSALDKHMGRTHATVLSTGRWTHILVPHSGPQWLVAGLFLAIVLFSSNYWQHAQEQKISELDVAILTDELPLEVFVD